MANIEKDKPKMVKNMEDPLNRDFFRKSSDGAHQGLTFKQKVWADAYLKHKNGTKAALEAYNTKSKVIAAQMASRNLAKEVVLEYLAQNGLGAAGRIERLSREALSEEVRLKANRDILDRAGIGVDRNKSNVIVPVQVNVNQDREEFK